MTTSVVTKRALLLELPGAFCRRASLKELETRGGFVGTGTTEDMQPMSEKLPDQRQPKKTCVPVQNENAGPLFSKEEENCDYRYKL